MEVAILGGGIGGLVAALFLYREGVPCRVYESTTEYKPLGVGLNLFSHAVSILTELGLGDALAKFGFEPASFLYLNQYGQEIYSEPCVLIFLITLFIAPIFTLSYMMLL